MREQRLLITGATGFVGTWMLRHWREVHPDVELWATSHQPDPPGRLADDFTVMDLGDSDAVQNLVARCQPTHVIHLAGLVDPNLALADHVAVNVLGTDHLYRALAGLPNAREIPIVQAGTAALYGPVTVEELPVKESAPLRPMHAYALSKVTQDYLAALYWRAHGLKTIRARVFNLLGPGQPESHVPSTFLSKLRQLGPDKTLRVGNLDTRRDFVDVRDVARAFDGLLRAGEPGKAYNIGSGGSVSIRDLLNEVIARSDRPDVKIEENDTNRRQHDVPDIYADIGAIRRDTGWAPEISLESSLDAMHNEERHSV